MAKEKKKEKTPTILAFTSAKFEGKKFIGEMNNGRSILSQIDDQDNPWHWAVTTHHTLVTTATTTFTMHCHRQFHRHSLSHHHHCTTTDTITISFHFHAAPVLTPRKTPSPHRKLSAPPSPPSNTPIFFSTQDLSYKKMCDRVVLTTIMIIKQQNAHKTII